MRAPSRDSGVHYDRVTAAWRLLMGEELHYGDFSDGFRSLADATRALTVRMRAAASIVPGEAVLDVGCGTGSQACHLVEADGALVVGITTSRVGAVTSRSRAAAAEFDSRVGVVVGDGSVLGFADGSFDVCWVLESSHLIRDRPALVRECARVLRPRGRLVLCDLMLQRPMPFDEIRDRRHELALLRAVFGDAHMNQLGHYAAMMEAEGLRVGTRVDLTTATRPTFEAWRENAATHRAEVIRRIGERGWSDFVGACDVLERYWDEGLLGYGLIVATR